MGVYSDVEQSKNLADIKIIDFPDWLRLHAKLLKEDKLAAFMQCHMRKNRLIICDINLIPNGYSIDDIVELINGKHIKL